MALTGTISKNYDVNIAIITIYSASLNLKFSISYHLINPPEYLFSNNLNATEFLMQHYIRANIPSYTESTNFIMDKLEALVKSSLVLPICILQKELDKLLKTKILL